MKKLCAAVAAVVTAIALAGCAANDDPTAVKRVTLTVFAASSLTKVFEQLGDEFEVEHQGVTVSFSFGGSSDLVTQIQSGAPVDVFASADEKNMAKLDAAEFASTPEKFATNTLMIAVAPGNPLHIDSLDDLANADLKTVLCAPQVPCGTASQKVLETAGVTVAPVSEEQSVTDVLGKVTSGEADAGLVYVSDVKGAHGAVTGVDFPEADGAVNVYPIVALLDSTHDDLAREFIDFVTGPDGRAALAAAGFGAV